MSNLPKTNQVSSAARLVMVPLLLAIACVLIYRALVVNMAYHMLGLNSTDERWLASSADFNIRKAAVAAEHEPEAALAYARQALLNKPVDARIYLFSGLAYDASKDVQRAEQMMQFAHQFGPRMPDNQLQLADFWAKHGNAAQALLNLSAALEMRSSLQAKLFPLIYRLAEMQATESAFQNLLKHDPHWWPAFFNYALRQGNDKVIHSLYLIREQTSPILPEKERQYYIDYLIRQHKSLQAYAIWLGGLTTVQMDELGYVNDGSFKLPASGEGFGWRFSQGKGMLLSRFEGAGALSAPSLRIGFYGSRLAVQELVTQYLMLEPGNYEFNSMFKAESLNAGEGIKWRVSCSNGQSLGSGSLLSGSQNWSSYAFRFEVPDSVACNMQKLTLISSPGGRRPFDYEGYVWFDELNIQKTELVP